MGLIDKIINRPNNVGPVVTQNSIKFIDYRFIILIDISQTKRCGKIAEYLQSYLLVLKQYTQNPKEGLLIMIRSLCTNSFLGKILL